MKKKLFMICAGLLCTGAMVVGSLNIWAANSMTESQIDNVEALDNATFEIICGGEPGLCLVRCVKCGIVIENGDSEQRTTHVSGLCPVCGGKYWFHQ